MSRIITVTSGKGGVGKSSISVNLAIALAHQNLKVCLIDGDFGLKNLDVMMGLENRVVYDLNDVISGKCEIHQVLVKDKREQTLYLLPACKTLSFQNLDASIMAALIDYLKNDFDFISILVTSTNEFADLASFLRLYPVELMVSTFVSL